LAIDGREANPYRSLSRPTAATSTSSSAIRAAPGSYADLTSITGGGGDANFSPALIAAYQWEAGATKQVVFGTADGHIHELVVAVGGKWKHHDLMKEHPGFPAAKP